MFSIGRKNYYASRSSEASRSSSPESLSSQSIIGDYSDVDSCIQIANQGFTWQKPMAISRSCSSNCSNYSSGSNDSLKDKRRVPPPPKRSIMYHPSRYKTELCRQWAELGFCEYSERCLFAHGNYELKPLPNRHPKYKTEMCSAFHEQGFCSFGPRCSFIHSKVDPITLLEEVARGLPKLPMPENPEDKENFLFNCNANELMITANGHRLPIFQKICSSKVP